MSATKKVLTSLHGKLIGLTQDKKLALFGRTVPTMDDTGATVVLQPAPVAVDTTATLTAANLKAGIITSAAAAVTGTLPTGTLLDASFTGADSLQVNDAFDWIVIKTGANSFTISAGTGHTIVGNAVVATVTSARFRTRKTAANTFVTYRIA
jgi:hypothetical protein